jgi:hypothetical protein
MQRVSAAVVSSAGRCVHFGGRAGPTCCHRTTRPSGAANLCLCREGGPWYVGQGVLITVSDIHVDWVAISILRYGGGRFPLTRCRKRCGIVG